MRRPSRDRIDALPTGSQARQLTLWWRGVAAYFRSYNAVVSVVETQPVLRLRALLAGFDVPAREAALASADIVVTVIGAPRVVTPANLSTVRDGVVLIGAGHLPWELDEPALLADPSVASLDEVTDGITTLVLGDGKRVHILTHGHMVNLAGPRPIGSSIESMDRGFTLQARCLEAVAGAYVPVTACVVPVPAEIDVLVASSYVALARG